MYTQHIHSRIDPTNPFIINKLCRRGFVIEIYQPESQTGPTVRVLLQNNQNQLIHYLSYQNIPIFQDSLQEY